MPGETTKVGYGRPPKHSQFAPGQSGNPKGRPKGSQNTTTMLREELDRMVPVIERGRQKLMSKRRIAVRQVVDNATRGDPKAFAILLKLEGGPSAGGSGAGRHEEAPSEIPVSTYEEVVAHHLAELVAAAKREDEA